MLPLACLTSVLCDHQSAVSPVALGVANYLGGGGRKARSLRGIEGGV